ncbi:MAG: hydrogenase iron-sulfur subunit, partial [Desulfohalobiaceae bacterium]|nr:hydrogenase iron-sulfur subunit [Desulfohalobiaceae bacterium]
LRLIEVPCAGKIDVETILRAFTLGAGAVVVLACHEGNCQSERGNTYAAWRVREMQKRLEALGFDDSRLVFATLASNMPREFARIAQETAARAS